MVEKQILQFYPRVNRVGEKVSIPNHDTFPKGRRKDLAFDGSSYYMVVHDDFDV